MTRTLLLSWFLVFSVNSSGQAVDSIRSIYIESYPDKFFVWPVLKRRSLSFEVGPRGNTNQAIRYKPNNSYSAGIGLYLFEVAAEISFAIPISEGSQVTYGNTDVRELRANVAGNAGGADVFLQRYKGFYYESGRSRFVKRPDLELSSAGLNGIFVFSKNQFSLRSAYNFSERQKKSGGSFILTGNLSTFHVRADSAIRLSKSAGPAGFQNLRTTTLSLAGGYTYSFVYHAFFLNGTFSIGPAHHWVQYNRASDKTRYDITINTYHDLRLAIGYNSDRFFGGIAWLAQSRNIRFDEVAFSDTLANLRLMAGYRFLETGILRQKAKDYVPVKLKR
jgi:hypothetical protein